MENPDNIKELLEMEAMERYLDGSMKAEELTQFEARMASDDVFAQEVALFMDMQKSIELNGNKELKASIKNVHNNLEKEAFFDTKAEVSSQTSTVSKKMEVAHKKSNISKLLSIAAGVAILLGAALFLLQDPDKPSKSEQFAKVYKPETKKIGEILDNLDGYGLADPEAERKGGLTTALELYEKGNYEEAKKLLATHLDKFKEDKIGKFYLGLCFLQDGEYAKASTHLQPLVIDSNTDWELFDESRWYLSLCYMMFDNEKGKESAIKVLKQIVEDPTTEYKVEAKYNLDYLSE